MAEMYYNVRVRHQYDGQQLMQMTGSREAIIAAFQLVLDAAPFWRDAKYPGRAEFYIDATVVSRG